MAPLRLSGHALLCGDLPGLWRIIAKGPTVSFLRVYLTLFQ